MSDTILSKVLETIESQSLPEGEYLQICSLVKECHIQMKNKETWIQVIKPISNRLGMDFYKTNRKCLSIDIKKAELWERNVKAGSAYVPKPDNTYIFEVTFYKNNSPLEEILKTIILKKNLFEISNYIGSLASLYCITKYEIFYNDSFLESFELFTWISEKKDRSVKTHKANNSNVNDSDDYCEENFINYMSTEMTKLVQLI
jgi:hypothetical protein